MTQSTSTMTTYICDRCGNQGSFTAAGQHACWANINAQYKDGSSLLPHGYAADLCVECAAELAEWFRQLAAKTERQEPGTRA